MARILIRAWKMRDAEQLALIANSSNVWNTVRDRLPHPYTVIDAMQWITYCVNEKPTQTFAVVCDNIVTGTVACVLKDDVYRKSVEIGYFIGEDYWGKGIATEAVRLLLKYVTKNFSPARLYAEVFENNKASMRVLQKNGFYLESIRRKAVIKNNVLLDDYVWVKLL